MRQRRAPRHDLAHPMRYVPNPDSAWNTTRVDLEVAELRRKWDAEQEAKIAAALEAEQEPPALEPFEPADHHPFYLYFSGRTRYHLEDPELAEYIDREKGPEVWRIRRLSFEQRDHIAYLQRKDQWEAAHRYAFFHGVLALEGGVAEDDEAGQKLAKVIRDLPTKRFAKQEEPLLEAIADYAMGVVDEVGSAIVQASMDLTAAEGKPSASQPGE